MLRPGGTGTPDTRALIATVLALAIVWTASAHATLIAFAPRIDLPLGPDGCTPEIDCAAAQLAVAAGDFNGDGLVDMATANNASGDVTVLLGSADGTLRVAGSFPVGFGPADIAAGDIDGDRTLDLVVPNELGDTAGIVLGNGDGSFQPPLNLPVGKSPEGVAVADFNADGNLDIATADLFGDTVNDPGDDTVSVVLGRGDGTFTERLKVFVPGGPAAIAAGDLNNDDVMDLAVSVSELAQVALLLGSGDGTFTVRDSVAVGDSPAGLLIRDLNGDGAADIAVANAFSHSLSVLLGRGDGTFETAQAYATGSFPEAVATADLDRDGHLDLVSADSFGTTELDGAVSVLAGRGDGTFASPQAFGVNLSPFGLAMVDLDGDHFLDIVTANVESDDISVLINTSIGPPTPTPTLTRTATPTATPSTTHTPPAPPTSTVGPSPLPSPGGTASASVTRAETPSPTPSATATPPPSATPTPAVCAGDCGEDGTVTVNELIIAVNIALGTFPSAQCPAADIDGNGSVAIDELIRAVAAALRGCMAVQTGRTQVRS